ncbi:MAG: hypothetical protein ACLTMP_03930 [Eggerthella lenta]
MDGSCGAGADRAVRDACGHRNSGAVAAGRGYRAVLVGGVVRVPAGDDALRRVAASGRAPSGVPLEAGEALGAFGWEAVVGIVVAAVLFAVLAWAGATWFSKREAA